MILLTGFTPFGPLAVNPSQLIVESIAARHHPDLITEVIPTEYQRARIRISALIEQFRPTAILSLGVAAGAPAIRLERVALNLNDCDHPDNAGEIIRAQPIVPGGPPAYTSTLPLSPLLASLHQQNIPATFSNHAGTFLCNHIFYLARHKLEHLNLPSPCGFIHVPDLSSKLTGNDTSGLPLSLMITAIDSCLDILRTGAPNSPSRR